MPAPGWQSSSFWISILWSLFQLYIASKVPGDRRRVDRHQHVRQHRRPGPLRAPRLRADAGHPRFPDVRPPPQDSPGTTGCWSPAASLPRSIWWSSASRSRTVRGSGAQPTSCFRASAWWCCWSRSIRSLGLPLVVIASLFLCLAFFGGYSDWVGSITNYGGASFSKAMGHYWMQTEGVFGVALGVSTSMIFLFVLFGVAARKSRRRQLVHQGRHRPARRAARRARQGRGAVVDDDRA